MLHMLSFTEEVMLNNRYYWPRLLKFRNLKSVNNFACVGMYFHMFSYTLMTIKYINAERVLLQFPPTTAGASRWQQRLAGLLRLRLLRENGNYSSQNTLNTDILKFNYL